MKKAFKKIFIVLFTVVVILVGTAPISSAESKYLIVVNSKKNTLNYYVNYTLVRSFRCSTGKLSTPTPQCKTTIVNKTAVKNSIVDDIKDVLGVGNISSSVSSSSTVDIRIVIGKDYK